MSVDCEQYQVEIYADNKRRLKQFMRKCTNLLVTTMPSIIVSRHKYTISRSDSNCTVDSNTSEIRLLHVNKLSDKISPLEALLLNFCHTIDDIKRLQKQPEKLDFLKLKPKEIEAMLMELLFVFEKRRCIEVAAVNVDKKRNKAKSTDMCCQRF